MLVGADSSVTAVNDLAWHHVEVTYDGSTAAIHIDGSAAGTTRRAKTGSIKDDGTRGESRGAPAIAVMCGAEPQGGW